MIEIKTNDKQKYFEENYPFANPPKLMDMKECIHCGNIITVGDYKVFRNEDDEEFICCPHALDRDGTVIDWFDVNNPR